MGAQEEVRKLGASGSMAGFVLAYFVFTLVAVK